MRALDGDPATIWHTQWGDSSPAHLHEITLDLGQPYALTGFRYRTKSGGCNGTIRDYEFSIGGDLKTLGTPVAKGTFANSTSWSWTVTLPITVTGRFVRLRALSEANGGPFTSIAELELLSDGVVFRAASSTVVGPPTVLSVAGAAGDPQLAELEAQYKTLIQDLKNKISANQALRVDASILKTDRDPLDIVLRRTAALLAHVQQLPGAPDLAGLGRDFQKIRAIAEATGLDLAEERGKLYVDVCRLRRQIAFSNPLLNFDSILFITRHRSRVDHMCDQYYGATINPGGGLCVLKQPFGAKPEVRDLLADAVVTDGRLKAQKLIGGSFLSPDLSFDGKQIAFAYVECKGSDKHVVHLDPGKGHWNEGRSYHVFTVNADGSGLKQITDGTWNDFDPCWLPNGRLAFISERRGGYLRCGRACPTYTLYDMAADGTDLRPLSVHETNEWHPSVMNDGRILYTRWDYVDRHGCVAHHPWTITPDGRDARAVHGNFSIKALRADMELDCRTVPNSAKFVATAAPHHNQAFGSLILVDPQVKDDDAMGPVRRITPEVGFPESQGGKLVYGTPWPLSDDYYLCIYDPGQKNYGIYLVDSFGNKELLYRDPKISCQSPIPLRPTVKPPVLPSPLPAMINVVRQPGTEIVLSVDGKPAEGTFAVIDTYNGLKPWPAGTKIKALRVYQILPLSVPSEGPGGVAHATGLQIPQGSDSINLARAILGTVPVEEDGSAYFYAPAHKELYFQALDEKGLAIQSMRSSAYLQPGERLTCQGCHEPRYNAPSTPKATPIALRRAPSRLQPDVDGTNPFSYPRLVQPVLDKNCVACHEKNVDKKAPPLDGKIVKAGFSGYMQPNTSYFTSYLSLTKKYGFYSYPDYHRTTPGQFGARASKLYEILQKGHHDVKLSTEDLHRITVWLDSVSLFYGVYEKAGGEAQLRGEIVKPTLE